MPLAKDNSTDFMPEGSDFEAIMQLLHYESGFAAADKKNGWYGFDYRYMPFRVPNGSQYVALYTPKKVVEKKSGKEVYLACLLRRYRKNPKSPYQWKIAKKTTRVHKWKVKELVYKWKCQKLGKEFIPTPRSKRNISDERRDELANRMLDIHGEKNNLPVFDKEFECGFCQHKWHEVTHKTGVIECPKCGSILSY